MHPLLRPAEISLLASLATVYLSGPMTGYPKHNFAAFEAACIALRSLGLTVLSPHEKDLQAGFDPESDGSTFDLAGALAWDVEAVMQSDAVIVLDGWEASPGCAIEVTVAEALGKPVLPLDVALRRQATSSPDCYTDATAGRSA